MKQHTGKDKEKVITGIDSIREIKANREIQPSAPPEGVKEGTKGHTPGEWEVYSNDWIYAGKKCIATIQETGNKEEQSANAKLIASAPQLLEENTLLKELLKDCYYEFDCYCDQQRETVKIQQRIKEILKF
jgi:hypothetical protein